jgi:hypothetical protein
MTKLKKDYIRAKNSNRQIKILGSAHLKQIEDNIYWKYRPDEINKWEAILKLHDDDDLEAVSTLVELSYKFRSKDIRKIKKILTKEKKKVLLKINLSNNGERYFTMNKTGISAIGDILSKEYWNVIDDVIGSDTMADVVSSNIVLGVSFEILKPPKKMFKNKDGGLFKHVNTSKIDLERYQIMGEDSDINITKENCLIYAFRKLGLSEDLINGVKISVKNGEYIRVKDLKNIANVIKKTIIIHKYGRNNKNILKMKYGNHEEEILIGMYDSHFFIFEKTDYTAFSIKNYNKIKMRERWNDISTIEKGNVMKRKKNTSKANSLLLIRLMHENKMFNSNHHKLLEIEGFQYDSDDKNIPLCNISEEQELFEYKESENTELSIFYADTESFVNGDKHEPCMMGVIKEGYKHTYITTYDKEKPNAHVLNMFNYCVSNSKPNEKIIIYFHNLKYDLSVLKEYIYIRDMCEKDNSIYSVNNTHFGREIELRDSYKLFNISIRKFCDTFGLPKDMNKKEAIAYEYYTKENFNKKHHSVDKYRKSIINEKDKETFTQALKDNKSLFKFKKVDGCEVFDAIAYYKHYLKYDCLVLMNGFKVFEEKMKKLTGLRIHNYLTISSLAFSYFASKDCFEDVYKVNSNLREYLQKAIVGGRCTVLESAKKQIINKRLSDYDACSLYPSAIYRMCLEMGLPIGKAKRIKQGITKKNLDKFNHYTITIKINKIRKKQQISFISMKNDDGILEYINKVPEGGYTCVVDKITLDDYIKFHKIKYEIIDGVYWDSGVNKNWGKIIKNMYDDRLEEKNKMKNGKTETERTSGNVMQNLIKLMLNSAYGKTIMKKSKTKNVIKKNGDTTDSYIYNNFHTIKEIKNINEKQCSIMVHSVDTSYNMAHIGGLVLSWSKRIMNEVMNTANDNGIKIYYQDTDSMHIETDQVKQLENLYFEEYGKILNGKNMCNFHSDFDLKGAVKEVYSIKSIFLGKKSYIDHITDGTTYDYHYRLKGVTDAGMKKAIKENYNNDPMKLYEYLANGGEEEFILNPLGSVSFKHTNNGVYTMDVNSFTRKVKF